MTDERHRELTKNLEDSLEAHLRDIARAHAEDQAVQRWVATARTHFEIGMMFLEKAIARPEGGLGRRNGG